MLAISRAERDRARACRGRSAGSAPLSAAVHLALTAISNAILRLFGVKPGELEEKHTSDDLKAIIASSRDRRRRSTPARR